jgi:hypothetical protein
MGKNNEINILLKLWRHRILFRVKMEIHEKYFNNNKHNNRVLNTGDPCTFSPVGPMVCNHSVEHLGELRGRNAFHQPWRWSQGNKLEGTKIQIIFYQSEVQKSTTSS